MTYSTLLDDIFDNLAMKSPGSSDIKGVKRSIEKTLLEMFSKGDTPRKVQAFATNTTADVTETFESTVDSRINLHGLTIDSGVVLFPDVGDYITVSPIMKMNTLNLKFRAVEVVAPGGAITDCQVTITVTNSHGDEGSSNVITIAGTAYTTFNIYVAISDPVGSSVKIEFTTKDINADRIELDELSWDYNQQSIEMPSDMMVPLEAVFYPNQSTANPYISDELTPEEFTKWVPNRISLGGGEINTTEDYVAEVSWRTEENIRYDYSIGFYFENVNNVWTLHYKPKFKGNAQVYYAYVPSFTVVEDDDVNLLSIFYECLEAGATERELDKLIITAESEIELQRITLVLRRFNAKYKESLATFAGHNRRNTETNFIRCNTVLVDPGMNIV